MPPPVVVLFVGDADGALSLLTALRRETTRDAHVVTVAPDPTAVADALGADDAADAVVVGPTADDVAATVADALADAAETLPVLVPEGTGTEQLGDHPTHVVDLEEPRATAETLLAATLSAPADAAPDVTHRGSDTYYAVDERWRVVDWDPRMADRTGVGSAAALGRSLWELLPEMRDTPARDAYARAMSERTQVTREFYYEPGDCWVTARVYPTPDGGLEVYTEEITRRKERETELEAAQQRLENTLERITDGFLALDEDWRVTYSNRQADRILDLPADVVGTTFWNLFPEGTGSRFHDEVTAAMEAQEARAFEERYDPLDLWFEVNVYPSENGLSLFFRDVTDRMRLIDSLERLQRATRELLDAETDTDVGEVAVTVTEDGLGLPLAVVWRHDDEDRLVPLASTPGVDRPSPLDRAGSDIWRVLDGGELMITDPGEPAIDRPDVDAAAYVPLGHHGVLAAYDTAGTLDETTVGLFRLLGAAVESALARLTERGD